MSMVINLIARVGLLCLAGDVHIGPMSDLKLFRVVDFKAEELKGSAMELEKKLQNLIEANMETFFGVKFLASEYSTGRKHKGRIDSIGIDENGSPVIFEYKRSRNENVVNQGLFYLDWLLDHKAEFELLVMKSFEQDKLEVDWINPRLLCVAGDFNQYDQYAVEQINRSIELIRYRDFNGELIAFELLTATTNPLSETEEASTSTSARAGRQQVAKTAVQLLAQANPALHDLFNDLEALLLGMGDDVTKTERKFYFAYRRLKNFACVEVHPQANALLVYVKVDPTTVELVDGFTRDVSKIGHYGTGDLEIRITGNSQLSQAEPLIAMSYANS
jgi:predicted transport protein